MDSTKLPVGMSDEKSSDGRPINLPGIYTNKDGKTFITAPGKEGILQADFLMTDPNHGHGVWERTGEVPSSIELKKMRKIQELKDAKTDAAQKKADEAEINAAVAGGEYVPEKEKVLAK